MRSQSYADIDPQTPEWLIPSLVQIGGVTYVLGNGGVGKSFLAADWVKRVTCGLPMPGERQEPMPVGSAILVSAEDDPNLAMSWRLRAAGADMDRVYDMTDDFELPGSLGTLCEDVDEINDPRSEINIGRRVAPVRLVVIDPLADVSSVSLTSGAVRIRRLLTNPLRNFARDRGVAVVVVCHTTKGGRMAGSAAIEQAARMVLRVERSLSNPAVRTIKVEKTNCARDDLGGLGYTLVGEGLEDTRVDYLEVVGGDVPTRTQSGPEKIMTVLQHAAGITPHDPRCPDCAAGRPTGTGALQTQEVSRRSNVDYGATRTALSRAKAAGEAVSPSRGTWTVPEAPATAGPVLGLPGAPGGPGEDSAGRADALADHCDACLADDHGACGQTPAGGECVCQHGQPRALHIVPDTEATAAEAESAAEPAEVAESAEAKRPAPRKRAPRRAAAK